MVGGGPVAAAGAEDAAVDHAGAHAYPVVFGCAFVALAAADVALADNGRAAGSGDEKDVVVHGRAVRGMAAQDAAADLTAVEDDLVSSGRALPARAARGVALQRAPDDKNGVAHGAALADTAGDGQRVSAFGNGDMVAVRQSFAGYGTHRVGFDLAAAQNDLVARGLGVREAAGQGSGDAAACHGDRVAKSRTVGPACHGSGDGAAENKDRVGNGAACLLAIFAVRGIFGGRVEACSDAAGDGAAEHDDAVP